jgi:hypothetical protein
VCAKHAGGSIPSISHTHTHTHTHTQDEETEAQRGEVTCLRSHNWEAVDIGCDPKKLILELWFFFGGGAVLVFELRAVYLLDRRSST